MIPERLSPHRFAAAIAERLHSVMPGGLSVRARGDVVVPDWWGGSAIADIVGREDGRTIVERVQTAAIAIMNSTQDEVMESTKQQWPMGSTGVAYPEARVIGEHLHLWFGEEAAPAFRLEPIALSEL